MLYIYTYILYIYIYYIYIYSVYTYIYVYLLTSVDVVPLMKTAGVVKNSVSCIYSIGLKCF